MNFIDQYLTTMTRLIQLCKNQKREIKVLKQQLADSKRTNADLKAKWQEEVNRRLSRS